MIPDMDGFSLDPSLGSQGWKCRGHSVASVSAAEQVLLSYAKSALPATSDVRVKVCHCSLDRENVVAEYRAAFWS